MNISHLLPRKLKKAARSLVFEEDKPRYNTKWKRRVEALLEQEEVPYLQNGEIGFNHPYVNPYGNCVNHYINMIEQE